MIRRMSVLVLCASSFALACDSGRSDAKPEAKPAGEAKAVGEAKADDAGVDPATAKKLAEASRALGSVSADQRSLLAGAALAEAESGRLPAPLVQALGEMQNVAPDMRSMIAMRALTDPSVLAPLQAMCDGKGTDVMASAARVAPAEQAQLIWDGCKLESAGLVTLEEAKTASTGQLVLAHVARQVLAGKGGPSADETALLRAFVLDTGTSGR